MLALVAPISGLSLAGSLFNRLRGGYASGYNMPICFFLCLISTTLGLLTVCNDSPGIVISFLFVQFFVGGFCMPALTAHMLLQVPPKERSLANSLANMCYNLLGYLPAPVVYGYTQDLWGERWGLATLQTFSMITLFASIAAFSISKLNFMYNVFL